MDPDDIELLRSATPAPRASTWEKAHARVAHEVAHEAAHGRVATHRPPRRARQLLAGVTILLAAAAATIAAIFATASSPPPYQQLERVCTSAKGLAPPPTGTHANPCVPRLPSGRGR